jgi:ABC-type bacteriocin/lantibiotic exporter with double-glycine peptidase domain
LTGSRIGIIFQAIGSAVIGIMVGLVASWKLTLVILCLSPIMIIAGKFRSEKQGNAGKLKSKDTFAEQGGQVFNKFSHFIYLWKYFILVCYTSD